MDGKTLKFRFNVDLSKLDEIMNKTSFKSFLREVRNGVISRETVKENYLPAGMSFEECEAEVLVEEMTDAFKRADLYSKDRIAKKLRQMAIEAEEHVKHEAKVIFDAETAQWHGEVYRRVVDHVLAGDSVAFIVPNKAALDRAHGSVMALLAKEPAAIKGSPHNKYRYEIDSNGNHASVTFLIAQVYGASIGEHVPVVVMEDTDKWRVPNHMTADQFEAEFRVIAAPRDGATCGPFIYKSDAQGRVKSRHDGVSETFFVSGRFLDQKSEGAVIRPVTGVPAAAASVKFTPHEFKEGDRIEVKFRVPKATDADVTCKDFCTMADLLSHGHNPGCPEKK